jgi:hypothetical protein
MVSFVAFDERGFTTPSHQFLRSLLQYYGLVLHNLIPSGGLHIATFMTLCETYLRVGPELDLWNYFFCVQCLQDLDVQLMVSGGAAIHVKSIHGVDPYFDITMHRSMKCGEKGDFT